MCAPGATAASLHQDVLLPLPGSAHWLAPVLSQRSGPGDDFLCPLPPLPIPTPLALPHLLSFKDRERARVPSPPRVFHMHGRLRSRALSGLPPPLPPPHPPNPIQPRAEGAAEGWGAEGEESGSCSSNPWRLLEPNSLLPQKLEEGTQSRNLQLVAQGGGVEGSFAGGHPTCSSLLFP